VRRLTRPSQHRLTRVVGTHFVITENSKEHAQMAEKPKQLAKGTKVKAHGIQLRELVHFNGKIGTIDSYQVLVKVYLVNFDDGSSQCIPRANLQVVNLESGTRVKVHGIQEPSMTQFNGKIGTVGSYLPMLKAHQVTFDDGSSPVIPRDNLQEVQTRAPPPLPTAASGGGAAATVQTPAETAAAAAMARAAQAAAMARAAVEKAMGNRVQTTPVAAPTGGAPAAVAGGTQIFESISGVENLVTGGTNKIVRHGNIDLRGGALQTGANAHNVNYNTWNHQ